MSTEFHGLEIAIIGMAGRFPGAIDLHAFWQNLQQGVESIATYSDAELQRWGVEPELLAHPQYVKQGAPLADIDAFDADFFSFSPREAEILDPQHRLFLECAWAALEDAGYDAEQYAGAIGVYGGAAMNGYLLNLYRNATIRDSVSPYQVFLASDKDFLTTRVSYKLNLQGPSLDIQTACSTSLVAVHVACQSLLSGECDMALAGGVAVSAPVGYLYQEGGIYSPDGHCRAFDAAAQGTVSGSGVGIVVLKRLEDAIADRDTIHAVIKGSAINNDGSEKVSYTAPSIAAQAKVIRSAQVMAGIEPDSIQYIETHGTGTPMGDPIEIAALDQVFRAQTPAKQFCAIGSLKPNIGHLDTAAGIASLIKVVLAIKQGQIPPSLHFQQPNPQIDFADTAFYVNTQLTEWHGLRRAGVSSFGIGGTNAHVILEAPPDTRPALPVDLPQLLLLSAKSPTALKTATHTLALHLQQQADLNLADVAYTLQRGRRSFEYRCMVVCHSREEAIQALSDPQHPTHQTVPATHRSIAFLFPGQGTQYVNMGRDLYDTEPIFRASIDRCCEILLPHLDLDLRTLLYPSLPTSPSSHPSTSLSTTALAQPALFTVTYALAQLLITWGVQPDAMIGHSIGEYVAACLANVLSLEDALRLVARRGQLMQQQATGAMLSVALSETALQSWLNENLNYDLLPDLTIAAHNAPSLSVVAGTEAAIAQLQQQFDAASIPCQLLHTSHAFHSPMMDVVQAPFITAFQDISLKSPMVPFISNVTGTWITAEQATDPVYWANHLRQTVRFCKGLTTLLQNPNWLLLEIGPGHTLSTFAKQVLDPIEHQNIPVLTTLPSARSSQSVQEQYSAQLQAEAVPEAGNLARRCLLEAIGALWLNGVDINWASFHQSDDELCHRVPLPTYPFERQRYWVEPQLPLANQLASQSESPVDTQSSKQLSTGFYRSTWERSHAHSRLEQILPQLMVQNQCWLVLRDTRYGDSIADHLTKAGHTVVIVTPGNQFTQQSDRAFTLNPSHPEEYRLLLQALQRRDLLPSQILHLWSLDTTLIPAATPLWAEDTVGFYSLLHLAQAAISHALNPLNFVIITDRTQEVIGSEEINHAQAKLLGLSQVIVQEYPYTCRCIDIDASTSQHSLRDMSHQLVSQVLAEIALPSSDRRSAFESIAYRGRYSWRQQFQSLHLSSSHGTEQLPSLLRSQGHYLVLGDTSSGLGKIWAANLKERYQAKVTVIIESDITESDITEPKSALLYDEFFNSLTVTKIADETALEQAIAQAELRFGSIDGVFYSTPMSNARSMALITDLEPEQCDYNFQTKVAALPALAKIVQTRSPKFCLLQSSLSSMIGGLGLAAYAAANRSLDAFAAQMQQNCDRTAWFSVNWDACQSDAQDTALSSARSTFSVLPDLALTPEEVWLATEQILATLPGQIVVSKTNLFDRMQQATQPSLSRSSQQVFSSELSVEPDHSSVTDTNHFRRSNLTADYVAPQTEIELQVAQIWQELLGIDRVGIHDSFFELGGHSLLAIQAIARLRETFQVELPMRNFLFEAPTVAGIAAAIASQQAPAQELAILAEILNEVQNLSPESIEQQLLTTTDSSQENTS